MQLYNDLNILLFYYKPAVFSWFQGIDDFKQFLKGTAGEKHWMLWIDIDRAHTLGPELIDMPTYVLYIIQESIIM